MSKQKIVFFGSGPVADESLAFLAEAFDIEAVVTKPRPSHHKEEMSTIAMARDHKLPLFTPANKSELASLFSAESFESQIGIVIDYGIIIPAGVIGEFPLGIINSHFSLLPEWRGADPITFSLLSGQQKTGISLMKIVEAMDEGPILAQKEVDIDESDTGPTLTTKLIQASNSLLLEVLPSYIEGAVSSRPQQGTPSYSRKLTKADGILDWHKPSERLEREIRAFAEWPKSRTTLAGKDIIITSAHAVPSNDPQRKPGDVTIVKEAGTILIECTEGYLCVERLKPAGKKEMTAAAFIAGYGHLFDQ